MVFKITELICFRFDLLFNFLDDIVDNFGVRGMDGRYFGINFLQKLQVNFLQSLVPISTPIGTFLPFFIQNGTLASQQTIVQILKRFILENLQKSISGVYDSF